MDSNEMLETPIDAIQNDEDEIAKMILSELEKQKKEKDEIAKLERTLSNEVQPPVVQQQQIQQPVQQQIQQPVQPIIQPELSSDSEELNKDILIIGILVFILSQPSIQNFFPKTNSIIRTILVSGLVAGGFFLYKKGNF